MVATKVRGLEERLAIKTEKGELKAVMGLAATTLTEAALISLMEDANLTAEARKTKMSKHLSRIPNYSRDFEVDIKKEIQAAVMSGSVGKVLSAS